MSTLGADALDWPEDPPGVVRTGDTITIAGVFKRRTWWQRLLRRPKALQQFTVNRSGAIDNFRRAIRRMHE